MNARANPTTTPTQVLADLLKMYASMMPQRKVNIVLGEHRVGSAEAPHAAEGQASTSSRDMPEHSSDQPTVTKVDAATQTDECGRVVGDDASPASNRTPGQQLRWDLVFYHPDKEAAFVSELHNVSTSTDLLQSLLLLALLAAAAFRQVDSVHTLQRVFVAMLVAVAAVAGAGVLGPCRRWYWTHREALVVSIRVMLALFALPAGQAILGRQQSSVGVLTSIALWGVPALTLRVRFTVHIIVHLALLSAMLTSASCHHVALGSLPMLPMLAQMTALVTFGFLLPTAAVYMTELRQRRRGVLVVLPRGKTVV